MIGTDALSEDTKRREELLEQELAAVEAENAQLKQDLASKQAALDKAVSAATLLLVARRASALAEQELNECIKLSGTPATELIRKANKTAAALREMVSRS